jgi:hypothetical protein
LISKQLLITFVLLYLFSLVKDPYKRACAEQLLQHPWILSALTPEQTLPYWPSEMNMNVLDTDSPANKLNKQRKKSIKPSIRRPSIFSSKPSVIPKRIHTDEKEKPKKFVPLPKYDVNTSLQTALHDLNLYDEFETVDTVETSKKQLEERKKIGGHTRQISGEHKSSTHLRHHSGEHKSSTHVRHHSGEHKSVTHIRHHSNEHKRHSRSGSIDSPYTPLRNISEPNIESTQDESPTTYDIDVSPLIIEPSSKIQFTQRPMSKRISRVRPNLKIQKNKLSINVSPYGATSPSGPLSPTDPFSLSPSLPAASVPVSPAHTTLRPKSSLASTSSPSASVPVTPSIGGFRRFVQTPKSPTINTKTIDVPIPEHDELHLLPELKLDEPMESKQPIEQSQQPSLPSSDPSTPPIIDQPLVKRPLVLSSRAVRSPPSLCSLTYVIPQKMSGLEHLTRNKQIVTDRKDARKQLRSSSIHVEPAPPTQRYVPPVSAKFKRPILNVKFNASSSSASSIYPIVQATPNSIQTNGHGMISSPVNEPNSAPIKLSLPKLSIGKKHKKTTKKKKKVKPTSKYTTFDWNRYIFV